MTLLSEAKCVACRGDEPPLSDAEIAWLQPEVPYGLSSKEMESSASSGSSNSRISPRPWP
jgi:hypothetical protein